MDASRFVFLEETGTATTMTRRYGRAPRRQRVVDAVPHGHWLITTFVAGLRESGIVAPLVVDGPMRGEIFKAYVEQMLVFLVLRQTQKEWKMPPREWSMAKAQFAILFEGRFRLR